MSLPPGQFQVEGFPRFGIRPDRPPPTVPANPVIEVRGSVAEPIDFPVAGLASLPRRELTADFHCVSGWSSLGLTWEGVGFETFYRDVISTAMPTGQVSHVVFGGMDGYRSAVLLDDALAGGVLLADHFEGSPLDGNHGAPVRVVSPDQYGFVSTKHLCTIELHTSRPRDHTRAAVKLGPFTVRSVLIEPHHRARVWREERHSYLPAWLIRPLYHRIARQILRITEGPAPTRTGRG